MSKSPLVTVYITTCNRAELLPRAIESVLAQTYRPIELIVVDDASQDQGVTRQVLADYQKHLTGEEGLDFIIIQQADNKGACAARNEAIKLARGEFITGLDDDDEFVGERLALFGSHWDARFSALCTSKEIDHGQGRVSYLSKGVGVIKTGDLLEKNRVGSQVFTLTERLRAIGGFDEKFPAWQDYETWIRLSLAYGDILKLPDVTYRVHTAHDKPRITSNEKSLEAIRLLRIKHGHRLSAHQRRQLLYRELVDAETGYKKLGPWLQAMTLRTFPQILKRWLLQQLSLRSGKKI